MLRKLSKFDKFRGNSIYEILTMIDIELNHLRTKLKVNEFNYG